MLIQKHIVHTNVYAHPIYIRTYLAHTNVYAHPHIRQSECNIYTHPHIHQKYIFFTPHVHAHTETYLIHTTLICSCRTRVNTQLRRPAPWVLEQMALQAAVVSGPFPAVLTTNWDSGLETAWEMLHWVERYALKCGGTASSWFRMGRVVLGVLRML